MTGNAKTATYGQGRVTLTRIFDVPCTSVTIDTLAELFLRSAAR